MKRYSFTINGNRYNVEIKTIEDNIAELEVNGTTYHVELGKEIQRPNTPKLVSYNLPITPKAPILTNPGLSIIKAPLPGTIISVTATPGMKIELDQPLLVLEAMKMENNIFAEKPGTIKTVHVTVGDTVMQGDILVEIE